MVGALGFSELPFDTLVTDGWRVESNRVRRIRADGVGSSCSTSATFDGGSLLRVNAPPSRSLEMRVTAQLGDAGAIGVALLVDATADNYYLLAIEPSSRCTTLRRRRAGGQWSTLASIDAVWSNSSSVAGLSGDATGDASMFGLSQCPLRTLDDHLISVVLVQQPDVPVRIAVRIDDALVFDYVDLVQPIGEPLRGQAALWCFRSQDCRFGSNVLVALDATQPTLATFVNSAVALQQNPPAAPGLATASLSDLSLDARNACVVNGTCASSVARDSAECEATLAPSTTAIDAYEALRVGWAAARNWPRRAPCAAPGVVCAPVAQQGSSACRRAGVDSSSLSSLPCCQRLGLVALLVDQAGPLCLIKPLLPDLSILVVNQQQIEIINATANCA